MFRKMDKRNGYLVMWGLMNIALPMFLGTVFYYLFCPNVWFVKMIDTVFNWNFHLPIPKSIVFSFIRNYLMDMLWAYSYTSTLRMMLSPICKATWLQVLIAIILCVLFEVIQLFEGFHGTFDFLDIFFEIAAVLLSFLCVKYRRNFNEKD